MKIGSAFSASTGLALLLFLLAPAAAAQEISNELYGNFRYSFNRAVDDGESLTSAVNNASRFGLRGSIGDGLAAFYQLETGASVDQQAGGVAFTQRLFLAGVRGTFGSVAVGRMNTGYKAAGLRVDPFYDTSTLTATAGVPVTGLHAGATFGLSRLTNTWANRMIQYTTPTRGGLTGNVSVAVDPQDDHDIGVGFRFRESGLDAGVQYYAHNSEGRNWGAAAGVDDALRLHARWDADGLWSIGVSGERLSPTIGDSQNLLYVMGTVQASERVMLAASVGAAGEGDAGHPEGTGFNLKGAWDLFPQSRLYALYSRASLDNGITRSVLSAGMTLNFSAGL